MRIKAKRVLWGYSPASVQIMIHTMKSKHEEHIENIEAEYEALTTENQRMMLETEQCRGERQHHDMKFEHFQGWLFGLDPKQLTAHIRQLKNLHDLEQLEWNTKLATIRGEQKLLKDRLILLKAEDQKEVNEETVQQLLPMVQNAIFFLEGYLEQESSTQVEVTYEEKRWL